MEKQKNKVQTNSGVAIQGNGHSITNNDIAAMNKMMSPVISLMEKKDEQISEVLEILKHKAIHVDKKDDQLSEVLKVIASKDEHINRLLAMLEKCQNDKIENNGCAI